MNTFTLTRPGASGARVMRRALAALGAAGLIGLAGPALGQPTETAGWVDATAFATIPIGATIVVTPSDRRRELVEYAGYLARALRGKGYAVADEGDYELRFELVEKVTGKRPPTALEITGSGGSASDTDIDVAVTRPRQTIGGGEAPGGISKPRQFELVAVAIDRSGADAWRASATVTPAETDDPSALRNRVARSLINLFGESGSGALLD